MSWGSTVRVPQELRGRRVSLRGLTAADFEAWQEVRRRCRDWLVKWEPRPARRLLAEPWWRENFRRPLFLLLRAVRR